MSRLPKREEDEFDFSDEQFDSRAHTARPLRIFQEPISLELKSQLEKGPRAIYFQTIRISQGWTILLLVFRGYTKLSLG